MTSSWFFLSTLNYDARSTTHQSCTKQLLTAIQLVSEAYRDCVWWPSSDEVTVEWRRLHNEELNDLYCSPNTVRVIKSRRLRWAWHVARMGEEYKSFSFSLCSLLQSPVTSSLLGPNILLNTLFLNTLSFLSSRNVSDKVSHPYKTSKIIFLYILIFKFLGLCWRTLFNII